MDTKIWTSSEALGYAITQLKTILAEEQAASQYHEHDPTYFVGMAANWAQIILALKAVA